MSLDLVDNNTNDISIFEEYIYNYMNEIPIFEKYNIFTIQKLNSSAYYFNNNITYEFSYDISRILITYQKDSSYTNYPSKSILKTVFNTLYNNLNTNNLTHFLSSYRGEYEEYQIKLYNNDKYKILNVGFLDIITTNGNDPKLNYELIKNAYLGFKYFNDLKKYFPTFGYTYCYMKCKEININNFNNKNWLCNKTNEKDNLVPYVITDNYIDDIDITEYNFNYIYEGYNDNNDNNDKRNKHILLQLISIMIYINNKILRKNEIKDTLDSDLLNNLPIKNIYSVYNYNGYTIPLFYNDKNDIIFLKTKFILYIPFISNEIGIKVLNNNNDNISKFNKYDDEKFYINTLLLEKMGDFINHYLNLNNDSLYDNYVDYITNNIPNNKTNNLNNQKDDIHFNHNKDIFKNKISIFEIKNLNNQKKDDIHFNHNTDIFFDALPYFKNKISIFEKNIYKYMNEISIFQKYNIFTIQKLNEIATNDNNNLKYDFSYNISQILITYQKDSSYRNNSSQSILTNFFSDNYNKIYNLNTNSLKYFLSSSEKKDDDSEKRNNVNKNNYYLIKLNNNDNDYKILNVGFLDIITTNNNDTDEKKYKLIKNTYLGFKYFNNLKKYFPTFGYTYCYMKCTKIDVENFNNKNWCNKTDNTDNLVPYVITDNYINNNNNNENNDNNDNNDERNKHILLQLISTMIYIKKEILDKNHDKDDKELISNLVIKNIYSIYNDKEYNIQLFYIDDNTIKIKILKTKFILYIPIINNTIERDLGINNISKFKKFNNKELGININDSNFDTMTTIGGLIDFFNLDKYNNTYMKTINNLEIQENSDLYGKGNNNLLNNYYYRLKGQDNEYDNFLQDSKINRIINKITLNPLNLFRSSNKENDSTTIDIKLTKFVSEYCSNNLKYMNKKNYNYADKKELEKSFNILIDKKIEYLNTELNNIKKNDNYNIKKIYNKYVKFIDILVKAQCLNYRVKLYEIFKIKMNLAKKINDFNIDNSEKDNMIYTIEESYKNLPNSNFFLNFILKTPLVDIIINAFIFYLFIYAVFWLYSFIIINNNNIEIIKKTIPNNYITSKNLGSIKKSLEYGAKVAYDLLNNYGGNVIVTWYRKLYNNGFINIPSIFDKFTFILPIVLNIIIKIGGILTYFKIYNYITNAINETIYADKFIRLKLNNLLSSNFPSMIYFMWEEEEGSIEK